MFGDHNAVANSSVLVSLLEPERPTRRRAGLLRLDEKRELSPRIGRPLHPLLHEWTITDI